MMSKPLPSPTQSPGARRWARSPLSRSMPLCVCLDPCRPRRTLPDAHGLYSGTLTRSLQQPVTFHTLPLPHTHTHTRTCPLSLASSLPRAGPSRRVADCHGRAWRGGHQVGSDPERQGRDPGGGLGRRRPACSLLEMRHGPHLPDLLPGGGTGRRQPLLHRVVAAERLVQPDDGADCRVPGQCSRWRPAGDDVHHRSSGNSRLP